MTDHERDLIQPWREHNQYLAGQLQDIKDSLYGLWALYCTIPPMNITSSETFWHEYPGRTIAQPGEIAHFLRSFEDTTREILGLSTPQAKPQADFDPLY